MVNANSFSLHLFKQNFKYSAAHFLIFDEKHAERLHGHNYKVRLDLKVPPILNPPGYSVDFGHIKKLVLDLVNKWDERVLLPGQHPEVKIEEKSQNLEVRFRDRFYAFPKVEVVILPIYNTSVEAMAKLLGESLKDEFQALGVVAFRIKIEETEGQAASCSFE